MRRVAVFFFVAITLLMFFGSRATSQNNSSSKVVRRTRVPIRREIPTAERRPELVFLENAEHLLRKEGEEYMILVGNVIFSKGGMMMYTDSAHYYEQDGSFNAYGNVRMEQGDTLFIYGDTLKYDGTFEIADLYGNYYNPARLINRDDTLESEIVSYDMKQELGYYTTRGILYSGDNRLESDEGEYSPASKDANFYGNVILISKRPDDTLTLVNDSLYYNTETNLAMFFVPTVITNKDGRIDSREGMYNTRTDKAELFEHSVVTTSRGSTLEGDTLFYNRKKGIGEAWGNMALIDTVKQSQLNGDYGFYDEFADSAFVTGRAVAKEYSEGDTLFVHGRYLTSVRRINILSRVIAVDTVYSTAQAITTHPDSLAFSGLVDTIDIRYNITQIADTSQTFEEPIYTLIERREEYQDSTHIISAWPRVRMFRSDIQGLCDSLVFTQSDSLVRMYHHPIVWNEDRQIFGNLIELHVNDSTVESATLPDFGFMAQHIEDQFYNQLTGKVMKAWFENGSLHRTLIEGSVEGIVYPEENDSTINKLVNFQTANLEGFFDGQVMKRMKLWSQTTGEAIPLYLAKYTDLHLPQFKWYEGLRPTSPADIFIIPEEMEELMADRPMPDEIPIPIAPIIEYEDSAVISEESQM